MQIFVLPYEPDSKKTAIVVKHTGVKAYVTPVQSGAYIDFYRTPELTKPQTEALLQELRADGTHAELVE